MSDIKTGCANCFVYGCMHSRCLSFSNSLRPVNPRIDWKNHWNSINHDSWYTPKKKHHRFASLQSIWASIKELDFQPICNLEIVHSGRLVL